MALFAAGAQAQTLSSQLSLDGSGALTGNQTLTLPVSGVTLNSVITLTPYTLTLVGAPNSTINTAANGYFAANANAPATTLNLLDGITFDGEGVDFQVLAQTGGDLTVSTQNTGSMTFQNYRWFSSSGGGGAIINTGPGNLTLVGEVILQNDYSAANDLVGGAGGIFSKGPLIIDGNLNAIGNFAGV